VEYGTGWLIFALVVLGVGNASLQLTSNISLAKSIPLHRQGLAFGVKQSAIPLAILLGGLAVPVISVVFGWRWTFIITGVFGVLVISYGFLLPRETPTKRSRSSRGERAPLKALLVAASAMAVASAAVNSFGAFIAAWGFQIGMTPSQTGYLMAAGSGASIAARVLTGHRADIRRGRNLPVVAGQMAVGGISLAFVSFDNVPMLWIAAILAFGVGWAWPGLMLFAAVRVGRDAPGAATGTIQAGAFLGGASGPALFGLLVAYSGYVIAWRASSLCMLLAAGLVLVSRRMFHRDRLERPPRTALGH
jgi:MFS family permease